MKQKHQECITFGLVVKALRKKQGYSQRVLAEKAEVHWTYMSGIERGERNPTLTIIHKIAHALKVSPSVLLEESQQL